MAWGAALEGEAMTPKKQDNGKRSPIDRVGLSFLKRENHKLLIHREKKSKSQVSTST
jgi:hypothetical protein